MAETIDLTIKAEVIKTKAYMTRTTDFGTTTQGPDYGNLTVQSGESAQYYNFQRIYNRSIAPVAGYPNTGVTDISTIYGWRGTVFSVSGASGAVLSGSITFTASGKGRLVILPRPAAECIPASYNYDALVNADTLTDFSAGTVTYTFRNSAEATLVCTNGFGVVPTYTGSMDTLSNVTGSVTYIATGSLPNVENISPVSESLLVTSETVFRWSYSHATGMPQTSWALHIVRNGVDSVLMSGQDSVTSCTVPADTLATGTAQWYVAVTAEEEGYTLAAQSEPSFMILRANPSTSNVSTDNQPRLTVDWLAIDQQAAQIRVGDTVYPTVWTDEGSYTIPEILSDGVYPVSVRTQTTEGDWSEWSEEIYADIKNVPPTGAEPPELTYTVAGTTASLWWTAVTGAEAYVLYRSGVPIYAGDGTAFVDARVSGLAEYKVRALLTGGGYIESAPQTLIIIPGADTLVYSDGGVPRELPIRHHPQYPTRRWDESADVEFNNYAGRTLPVAVYDGHVSRGLTLTAAYRSPQEAASLLSLLGKTVIYKSKKGDGCRGVIVSASRDSSLTDAVTYRITATDDDERAYLT